MVSADTTNADPPSRRKRPRDTESHEFESLYRQESDLHIRDLPRGGHGIPVLSLPETRRLARDITSSDSDLYWVRFFNVTSYTLEHVYKQRTEILTRQGCLDHLDIDSDDDCYEYGENVPWYNLKPFRGKNQEAWHEPGGPISKLREILPNVRHLTSTDKHATWDVTETDGSISNLPCLNEQDMTKLLVRWWRKVLETVRDTPVLQHQGTAKYHERRYKVFPAERKVQKRSKKNANTGRSIVHNKLAGQGRLFLINPEDAAAWHDTASPRRKENRIERCLLKDGTLSVYFDDLVTDTVRIETGKNPGQDYSVSDLELDKLHAIMKNNGLSGLQLGYCATPFDDGAAVSIVSTDEELAEAIAAQVRHQRFGGYTDDYMLFARGTMLERIHIEA